MSALRPRSTRLAGATLVEMVLTVAILAIAAAIAVPRSAPVSAAAVDGMAGAIANALRFGQQEAIRTGRYYIVQIDPAANTLSVSRLTGSGAIATDTAFTVLHPVDRREFVVNLANNSFSGAAIVGSVFQYAGGPTTTYASFGPDGAPAYISGSWNNNGVPTNLDPLQGDGVVTIRHGQAERQIRLNPVTGRVTY
jgi:Tfp pilus assembly protein FimT